jgi:hypothetical protein
MDMQTQSLMVALMAVAVSAVSFYFSVQSWQESNRPLVTARITSFGLGGNIAIPLSLLIENTGSRPAKNVKLKVEDEVLNRAILPNVEHVEMIEAIKLCFSERGVIPVLANGTVVHNNFGLLKSESEGTWKPNSRFDVTLQYEDLDGRTYRHTNPLLLADDRGFAGSFWNSVYTASKRRKEI